MTFKNKVSLITGAARGLGAAITEQLASEGSTVFMADVDSKSLDAAYLKLKDKGYKCYKRLIDITHKNEVKDMFSYLYEKEGHLDILVNNAGIIKDSFFHKMGDPDWDEVIKVNLYGTYYCCKAAIEGMRNQCYGRIVNISSVVGVAGNMGQTNYASSKAAVIGLTKALALESATKGITVNAIAPGFINTDMSASIPDKVKEKIIARIPVGRFGGPGDIANMVAYLASKKAAYITGQVININGGFYI